MKIICIGRNYSEHIKELKNETPENPIVFLKPDTSILLKKQPFFIPDFSNDVHHEIEVIIKINKIGKHIQPQFAHTYYNAISIGIDFTARDVQDELRAKGLPWECSKSFDGATVIGKWVPKEKFSDINRLGFTLQKNDQIVQKGNTQDMLHNIDALIAYISKYFTLKIGDIIFTGTPAGVGPVAVNDKLSGFLEGEELFNIKVK